MKKTIIAIALGLAGLAFPAAAQVAGSTNIGVAVTAFSDIAEGWSVKKTILGKTVHNDAGEKIGKVEDVIIGLDKSVSYLIVGAGGFVGIGRHDVAIPIAQIRDEGGRIVLPGASKESIKAMPQFAYTTDTTRRDQFVARADKDIAAAKDKMAAVEKKAAAASGEAKTKLDRQMVVLRQDMKSAEEKLGEMKRAGTKKWHELEADVSRAITRVKLSIEKAVA
jgi:sporulation protein YlmC with PRC-barrel domain